MRKIIKAIYRIVLKPFLYMSDITDELMDEYLERRQYEEHN